MSEAVARLVVAGAAVCFAAGMALAGLALGRGPERLDTAAVVRLAQGAAGSGER